VENVSESNPGEGVHSIPQLGSFLFDLAINQVNPLLERVRGALGVRRMFLPGPAEYEFREVIGRFSLDKLPAAFKNRSAWSSPNVYVIRFKPS
jgi:hypothetical protein